MALARPQHGPAPPSPFLRDLVRRLYVAHAGRVSNVLRLRGVPKSEREDLAHEVFARVQEGWSRCQSQGAPLSWIEEIARNVEREHRRARQKEEVLVPDADVTTVAAPELDAQAHQAARIDLVARLLAEIRNEERREIVTRRLEGQSNREIAEALHLPVARVGKQYQRGYAELLAARDRHRARERHEAATRKHAVVLPFFCITSASLFEGLLDEEKAPESLEARVWERLQAHGGGGGEGDGPAVPGLPPAPPPPAAPVSWTSVLVAVGCVVAVVELAIILALLKHPPQRSHVEPADVRPEVIAAVVTSAPAPSAAPPPSAGPAPRSAPALPAFRAPAQPSAPADREHRLIDRAAAALDRGDRAAALAALDEYARDFPGGALTEWRDRLRTKARAVVVRSERARVRAQSLSAPHPQALRP